MLRFTTTDQASNAHGLKCGVYGGAGAGKTRLCRTAPSPIILSAEAGLLSLRQHRIPAIEIRSFAELGEAFLWVSRSREARQFGTICLDSGSELAEVILADAMRTVGAKDPRRAYADLAPKFVAMIKDFRDLVGFNVYITFKMEPMADANGIIKYRPSMPGQKLSNEVPYLFDEMFCLRSAQAADGRMYDFLQTKSDMQYDAKDRSGSLDAYEPPDLSHIFRKILGA